MIFTQSKWINFLWIALVLSACSGKPGGTLSSQSGAFLITGAESLFIDTSGIQELNLNSDSYEVTLNSISNDFQTNKPVQDLTDQVKSNTATGNLHKIILAKSLNATYPLVVIYHEDTTDTYMQDVIYSDASTAKPGLVSTMAYNLIKYYPGRGLNDYSATDFAGIKTLIQNRVTQMLSESETLSFTSVPYSTLARYFTNGVAFNPGFLNQVQAYGVKYGYTLASPNNLLASDTPEGPQDQNGGLADVYKYATHFTLNGSPVTINPFNQINSAARFQPVATPSTVAGTDIHVFSTHDTFTVQEGWAVQVVGSAVDIDGNGDGVGPGEFIDKSFVVQYIPRKLPVGKALRIPEPISEYFTIPSTNAYGSAVPETYTSNTIAYNEALDTTTYPSPADTAYRNVYFLISDGMVRIPYHWKFIYGDTNQAPVIIKSASGDINDSSFDSNLIAKLGHGSLCTPTASQAIFAKADGPWNCAFRVYDPDLDADPNSAADQYYFSVTNMLTDAVTTSTTINFIFPALSLPNAVDKAWVAPGYPTAAPKEEAATVASGNVLSTCVDAAGKTHNNCGVGIFSVVTNNALANAPTVDPVTHTINFIYNMMVEDRLRTAGNVQSATATINRLVLINPHPPRLVNFSEPAKPSGLPTADTIADEANPSLPNNVKYDGYLRTDLYLDEIKNATSGAPLNVLGFSSDSSATSANTIAGSSTDLTNTNRKNFSLNLTVPHLKKTLSPYFTQPRAIPEGSISGSGTAFSPYVHSPSQGYATLLGNSLQVGDVGTYHSPYEVDKICSIDSNNKGSDAEGSWDQSASFGWVFEINAIDTDNVSLSPNEVSDPVYFTSTDTAANLNKAGFSFCAYKNPNADPSVYQTYAAIGALPAVDPEACTWTNALPTAFQPIPVFYTQVINGLSTPQKTVYHRLRVKWTPTTANTSLATVGFYLQNMISGLSLYGNQYNNYLLHPSLGQPLSDRSNISNLALYATRKNMDPCLISTFGTGKANTSNASNTTGVNYVHQNDSFSSSSFNVLVNDENQVATGSGRAQAEFALLGTRSILDYRFFSYIPFTQNCSSYTNATTTLKEPAVWYATADGTPKTRLSSQTGASNALQSPICLNIGYAPVVDASPTPNPYRYVITITKTSTAANSDIHLLTTDLFGLTGSACASFEGGTGLHILSDQKYTAIASKCSLVFGSGGSGLTAWTASMSNTTSTTGTLDPTAYGFSAGSPINLDLFPWLYGTTYPTIPYSPTAQDSINSLVFNVSPIDTFVVDDGVKYGVTPSVTPSGLPLSISGLVNTQTINGAINTTGADLADSVLSTDFSSVFPQVNAQFTYVDWDNDLSNVAIVGPTPNPATNTYVTLSGITISLYSKNHTPIALPIQTTDLSTPGSGYDLDPYDVHTFAFLSGPVVSPSGSITNAPFLYSNTRTATTNCSDAPAGYPGNLATLNATNLIPFHQCQIKWNPAAGDDGKTYTYTLAVQDNFGASGSTPGVGGIFPDGGTFQTGNTSPAHNSSTQLKNLTVTMTSYEINVMPTITNSSGGTYASGTNGVTGWSSVFTSTGHASDAFATYGSCPTSGCLTIQDGDQINSNAPGTTPTPYLMTEGSTTYPFSIKATSTLVTPALKTLTGTLPGYVLILGGTLAGQYYTPTGMTTLTTTQATPGNATFSFNWTPTDKDAFYLSNTSGFLIPVRVCTGRYPSDPSFPLQTPALCENVWTWGRMNVVNNAPTVTSLPSGSTTETSLDGGTLIFQTSTANSYTVKIKDSDIARIQYGSDSSGFTTSINTGALPFALTVGSMTPASLTTAAISGSNAVQTFTLSGNPSTIGGPYPITLTLNDPGDPSRGLALNYDGGTGRAAVNTGPSNAISITFNIQVVGKPTFLAPSGTTPQAYAYVGQPFSNPTSLLVSRPFEDNRPFFVGLDVRDVYGSGAGHGVTAAATPADLYVDQNQVLRWAGPSSSNPSIAGVSSSFPPTAGVSKTVNLYGTMDYVYSSSFSPPTSLGSGCSISNRFTCGSTGSTTCDANTASYTTLVRWNSTSNKLEYCHIPANSVGYYLTPAQPLTVNVLAPASINSIPTFTSTQAAPTSTTRPPTSSFTKNDLTNLQFSEFFGRCGITCLTGILTSGGESISGASMTHGSSTGTISYTRQTTSPTASNFTSQFTYDESGSNTVTTKLFSDNAPSSVNSMVLSAQPGDSITLTANASLPAPSYNQYRWYINGCLKSTGVVSSGALTYTLPITSMMGGLNNDCTAQYALTEAATLNTLGKLTVRLTVEAGTKLYNPPSTDTSVENTYTWTINVVKTTPVLPAPTYLQKGIPMVLNSTSFTAVNGGADFAMIVNSYHSGASADYFTYSDSGGAYKMHLLGINSAGDAGTTTISTAAVTPTMTVTASGLTLTCPSMSGSPTWAGVQSSGTSPSTVALTIAASTVNTIDTTSKTLYNSVQNNCFGTINGSGLNASTTTINPTNLSSNPAVGGYAAFSKYNQSKTNTSSFVLSGAGIYDGSANANSKYFLIQDQNASSSFWDYLVSSIYTGGVPSALTTYSDNGVRKNLMINSSTLTQFIGAKNSSASAWKGSILIGGIAQSGTSIHNLALPTGSSHSINFSYSNPSANDCPFDGTPLDGIYVPSNDTLFSLVNHQQNTGVGSTDTATDGKIVAIQGASTSSPKCVVIGNVLAPSLDSSIHNSNLAKMALDSANGLIFGIITSASSTSQMYVIDVFAQKVSTYNLSSNIHPYAILHSPLNNATYLYDNTRVNSSGLFPTLYRVW